MKRRSRLRKLVRSLSIVGRDGRRSSLWNLRLGQEKLLDAWATHRKILALKCRQEGITTAGSACVFAEIYTAPDPVSALQMAHGAVAGYRMNAMVRGFLAGLPDGLPKRLTRDNRNELEFAHNGGSMRQYWAGGRGQGRSHTYNIFHATEPAAWPTGTASAKSEGQADRDTFSSVMATLHDNPYYKVLVEGTGDGPSGLYFELTKIAKKSSDEGGEWAFLFMPWQDAPDYAIDPPDNWERTKEEEELAGQFGLSDRQLAWRRRKLVDESYTLVRFRREYPSTWLEPFMSSGLTWFDSEMINKLVGRLPITWHRKAFHGGERVYYEPEPGRTYFIGQDTTGGTGGDPGAIVVLRDDFEVACVWSSNIVSPDGQADKAAELSARYNRAQILCEANKYGKAVIERLERVYRANVWKEGKPAKDFYMLGGRAGQTKKKVYSHARGLVDNARCCSTSPDQLAGINDEIILEELLIVREDKGGNIQAPDGSHDDHADAYVLALWCGREYYERAEKPVDHDALRMRKMRNAARRARR